MAGRNEFQIQQDDVTFQVDGCALHERLAYVRSAGKSTTGLASDLALSKQSAPEKRDSSAAIQYSRSTNPSTVGNFKRDTGAWIAVTGINELGTNPQMLKSGNQRRHGRNFERSGDDCGQIEARFAS